MDKILKKQATTAKMKLQTSKYPLRDTHGADMILTARRAIYESSEVRKNWEEWVQALESGEYEQDGDGGVLNRYIDDEYSTYCCLGVACDLQGVSWQLDQSNSVYTYSSEYTAMARDCLPDHDLMNQAFGVIKEGHDEGNDIYLIVKYRRDGEYHHGLTQASGMNDDGVSFARIAQAIRNTYLNPVDEWIAKGL